MLNETPNNRERRALDRLRDDIGITNEPVVSFRDEQDGMGAARIARMTPAQVRSAIDRQRERAEEPRDRCPHCMKPVTYEPAQHYTERCHGAPVAFEYRASYGCDECGIEIPEDQIVRVA